MRIIDALLGEHGVFYAQFDHIEAALAAGAPPEAVREMAAVLAAGLAPHAHIEDELLFGPAIEAGAPEAPLLVMHQDHEGIEQALEEAQSTSDPGHARSQLLAAVRAARDHFVKEERIAFMLAERALGEERLRALGDRWAAARGVALEPAF
jgi:iron-sulfur cluster repair protein YtfE (RIC family)